MLLCPQHMQQQDLYHEQHLHARLQALRPGVRVVFMSGFSDVEIGEVPFIAKPFAAIKLLRTLREALAPKRAG